MADITHGTWLKDGKAVDAVYQSGIKVYGRNLLLGSEAPSMCLYNASPTGTNVYSTKTSDGWQRFVLNGGSIKFNTELLPQSGIYFDVIAGTTYTQSLEIRTDATVDLSTFDIITWYTNDRSHNFQNAVTTKTGAQTYLISCTYTPNYTDTVRALDMYLNNVAFATSGTFLDIRYGKAEISKNATPWSPAPEDILN